MADELRAAAILATERTALQTYLWWNPQGRVELESKPFTGKPYAPEWRRR